MTLRLAAERPLFRRISRPSTRGEVSRPRASAPSAPGELFALKHCRDAGSREADLAGDFAFAVSEAEQVCCFDLPLLPHPGPHPSGHALRRGAVDAGLLHDLADDVLRSGRSD